MITDGIQQAMIAALPPHLRTVMRSRMVEALGVIDRDAAHAAGLGSAGRTRSVAPVRAPDRIARESIRFVYRAALENGRPVAKRAPQVTDTRYWSCMLDRKG